jgi:hypothetical protein
LIPNPKLKLLDQVSEVMRFKHYSLRTERTYQEWIKRYIFFHGKRHPREMGAFEVERFLSDLATRCKVAASTPTDPHPLSSPRPPSPDTWPVRTDTGPDLRAGSIPGGAADSAPPRPHMAPAT